MVEALRDGQIDANAVAMEFLTYPPALGHVERPAGHRRPRDLSRSTAPTSGISRVPREASSARASSTRTTRRPCCRGPGSGYSSTGVGRRNNLVVSWIDGAVSENEVTRTVKVIRAEMDWIEAR